MKKPETPRIKREEALALFSEDIYTLGEKATGVKRAVLGSRADYASLSSIETSTLPISAQPAATSVRFTAMLMTLRHLP